MLAGPEQIDVNDISLVGKKTDEALKLLDSRDTTTFEDTYVKEITHLDTLINPVKDNGEIDKERALPNQREILAIIDNFLLA